MLQEQLTEEQRRAHFRKEFPSRVYKYRDWKDPYHKRLLTEREIYFSHPNRLNDPLDCNRLIRYDLLNPAQRKKWATAVIKSIHPNWNRQAIRREVRHMIPQSQMSSSSLRDFGDSLLEESRDRYGIFSVSGDENILEQWEDYADHYRGFCVGFDTYRLFQSTASTLKVVNYMPSPLPPLLPSLNSDFGSATMENLIGQTFVKTDQWSKEDEYRFAKINITHDSQRTVQLPPKVFKEVILGHSISSTDEEEIRSILANQMFSHVKVTKR